MNGPSSDGNENVIDIFVLCKSETEVPLKTEHLEQKGYRVTLFSDSSSLLETLRLGKPNLLICDSLSLGQEAYDVCRQIKEDNSLWMIPVLILTGASNLSDLLFVLDCNADNFIAHPCDPSYLLSLIEGMLVTPVERQTPDQIKTQFRIQHDEHIFVVTADRRKLLEFLLSSFEIAVNKSDGLVRAEHENEGLVRSVKRSEESAAEQARIIDIMNVTLQQKEQKIGDLTAEVNDVMHRLSDVTREKDFLVVEREENKTRIADADEQIRITVQEKDELARLHSSETGELHKQISGLSEELKITSAELAKIKQELDKEIARRDTAEATLGELLPQKEQLEKSLRGLSLEHEQVRSSFSIEKNRAQSAEQEIRALHQAKAESEQDLTRIINELKETAKQQAEVIIALKEERTVSQNQVMSVESRLNALTAEKEQAEDTYKKNSDTLKTDLAVLQEQYASATAALEEKDRQNQSLERAVNELKSSRDQSQTALTTLKEERISNQDRITTLETRLSSLAAEKEQAECAHKKNADALRKDLGDLQEQYASVSAALEEKDRQNQSLEQEQTGLKTSLEQSQTTIQTLKNDLGMVREALEQEKTEHAAAKERLNQSLGQVQAELKSSLEQSQTTIQTLKNDLGMVREALEQEKTEHAAAEDRLQVAIRERDLTLAELRGEHNEVKTDLDAHRDDLALVKSELAVTAAERTSLKSSLDESRAQVRDLEEKLHSASVHQAEYDRQARSLSDELDKVKAALESERRQSRTTEEDSRALASENEKYKEELEQSRKEQERLTAVLAAEREQSRKSEEIVRAAEEIKDHRIEELSSDLTDVTTRLRLFEEQIQTITLEKAEADLKVASLSAEINQARAALADEWEDHMNDHERLAVAVEEKKQLEESLQKTIEFESDDEKSHAVVVRTSALPMNASTSSVALANCNESQEAMIPPASSFDDLSGEEGTSLEQDDDTPAVSIVREPAMEETPEITPASVEDTDTGSLNTDTASDDLTAPPVSYQELEMSPDESGPSAGAGFEEFPQDPDDETYGGGGSIPVSGSGYRPAPPFGGISFNRAQWLDLLKWAHHSGALSQEQRLQIVRMGRLIQRGRKLTQKQDEQIREMITLAQSLGYRSV